MKLLNLVIALPVGRIFDALEHLPEQIIAAHRPSPAQIIAVDAQLPPDARALHLTCTNAIAGGAELLIVAGASPLLSEAGPLPLPVISVSADATLQGISRRIKQLEHDSLSPRLLDEEHVRTEIAGIVDRAADALGGHIIVEDREFQMLVYSQFVGPIDEARRDAIMQRRMPGYLQQVFNAQGVQASLIRGEDTVTVAPDEATGLGPRLVVAIRHRGRLVGTIWFARATPTFTAFDIATLSDAAQQMSEILAAVLRLRDDAQITRDDAALDLLAGRRVSDALQAVGIDTADFGSGAHVITFALAPGQPEAHTVRLADFRVLVANSSWAVQHEAVTVAEGERLHIIHVDCGGDGPDCDAAAPRLLASYFTESLQRVGLRVAVGIGDHARTPDDIAGSAKSADSVLAVLLREKRSEIATSQELWAQLLLDLMLNREVPMPGQLPAALTTLLTARSERERELLATVSAVLDRWGDISGAARQLHVHHNTVRYRLQRFAETTGIDLDTPEARLAVWMVVKRAELGRAETAGKAVAAPQ